MQDDPSKRWLCGKCGTPSAGNCAMYRIVDDDDDETCRVM